MTHFSPQKTYSISIIIGTLLFQITTVFNNLKNPFGLEREINAHCHICELTLGRLHCGATPIVFDRKIHRADLARLLFAYGLSVHSREIVEIER